MLKRIIAMFLCVVCLLLTFVGCAKSENDKGPYIRMYLGEPVYDLDPLNAFDNQATLQIVSLLFQGLFYADEDGDVEKGLVEDYEYLADADENKYVLTLILKEAKWSDGVAVSATDAQYAFLRLFNPAVSNSAKAALFDIKNARAIAKGNDSVDHLGVVAKDQTTLEIEFEYDIDVDSFLVSLCSPALYPLRSDKVDGNPNWAKEASEIVCNGPFIVKSMNYTDADGFVLERNSYYYRDRTKDDVDVSVTPYRLIIDFATPGAAQLATLNSGEKGEVNFFGYIPLASRTEANASILEDVDVSDAVSTLAFYLNQNAIIGNETLFANKSVRQALSLVLDRKTIAEALVYAEAADGLVPKTILNRADKSDTFREEAESYISATANVEEAKRLLTEAGINASDYTFAITVNAGDEEHVKVAELTQAAWSALDFHVTINALGVTEIMDTTDPQKPVGTGMYESNYKTALNSGNFEVIVLDIVATAPTAFSYLAPFAKGFTGNAIDMNNETNPYYNLPTHITGYNSAVYNATISGAYAIKNEKLRAVELHKAEAILMDDMPVIPVVYNQNVSLAGDGVSKVQSTFFCPNYFIKTTLSDYWDIAIREGFVKEDED